VRLEGSLDAFSLPDIFALLSMTKKTGGLHLRRPHAHGVVWFTTGSLTGGASDVSRQGLARRVVGSIHLDAETLQRAVDDSSSDDALGVVRALQQAGVVEEGMLHDLVGEHIVDTVFDLLRWPDGDFAFVIDEPNPDDVGVTRQVDDIVTESRRRLESWKNVAATIPSPAAVLSVPAVLSTDPQLSRDEWALLALVDGRRSVAQIVGLAGRGEFSVVSALAELVSRGLLRVNDGDQISALMRSHDLLARLEGGAPVDTAPVEPAPAPAESAPGPVAVQPPAVATDDDDEDDVDDEAQATAPPTLTAVPSQPTDRGEITPKRPEPFLPKRQPAHPEEPMPAVAAVAGGAAAAAPAAAPYIERDPSVNKSLLLRLIAGVRGL
jgi:hypothetical protein